MTAPSPPAAGSCRARAPRILFLGLNYAPERIGIAVYSTGLCEAFAAAGFDVEVVSAVPYYPDWRVFDGYRRLLPRRTRENGVSVTRVPLYVPQRPSGAKRLLHHLSFAIICSPVMLWRALRRGPDLVVTVAPSLIAAPVAAAIARLFGARSWLHVQDFEVGAAFATGLLRPDRGAAALATGFERRVMRAFDRVSSISTEMCARLLRLGVAPERVFELRNWADIGRIEPLARPSAFRARWNVTARHVALYSGNIANKQGIEVVVEAARLLSDRDDIAFVICGEGPNRARLEALAEGLDQVRFHDLQPVEDLADLLGLATIWCYPRS
jgi:colanic acid biosynthesis glycosyl transferase WcaI